MYFTGFTADYLKKIVILLIISEFILTSLGYCGHDHDHGAYPGECAYDAMQLTESESDQHRPPHTHDQEKGNDKSKKCYCSCLGGFIACINQIHYQVILQLTSLEHESINLYHYLYIPFIYHPPIART